MNKKAQGLSFNMIVVAIIALFVLLLIIAWATGAFNFLFGQTKTVAEATDVDVTAAQTKCTQYCLQAQTIDNIDDWQASTYCKHTFTGKDWEGTGVPQDKKCWQFPIGSLCSTNDEQFTDGDCL